jgi:hypothetical protein
LSTELKLNTMRATLIPNAKAGTPTRQMNCCKAGDGDLDAAWCGPKKIRRTPGKNFQA